MRVVRLFDGTLARVFLLRAFYDGKKIPVLRSQWYTCMYACICSQEPVQEPFSSFAVLVSRTPHFQLLGGVVLATVGVAVQFTARPFINFSLNILVLGLWINDVCDACDLAAAGVYGGHLHCILHHVRLCVS